MMRTLLSTLLLLLTASAALIADDTTRGGNLRADRDALTIARPTALPDTMNLIDGNITVSGYDKPLRATREAMFLTNHTGVDISGIELEMVYTDMKGRELHRRTVNVACTIPSGATRRADIPSWDTQHTFFYVRGITPRRDRTAPYDVAIKAVKAIVYR